MQTEPAQTEKPQINQPQAQKPTPRELEIEKRKTFFHLKLKIAAFVVVGIIAAILIYFMGVRVYHKTKKTYVTTPATKQTLPPDAIIITEEVAAKVEEWEIYSTDRYRFSFDYPKGDALIVENLTEESISVEVNSANIIPKENPDGENLVKGYIFQVKPLNLSAKDIQNAARVKRDWFVSNCPKTANIKNVEKKTTAGFDSQGFEVLDCNSDYYFRYVAANDYVYEISQILKGDLGFKQVYKSRLNQIQKSLTIDVDAPEQSPYETYVHHQINLSFDYPRELDKDCCSVPTPPQGDLDNLVTLSESDNSHALGVFHSYRLRGTNFDDYIKEQKVRLVDEYTIIKNKPPTGTESEITVSGRTAVKLEDYSWRGNDLIYIPISRKNIIFISYTDISQETLDIILNSFKVN